MSIRWTRSKVREFVRRMRKTASEGGCKKCQRDGILLGLKGSPALSDMIRDGMLFGNVKVEIKRRGWFCKGCVSELRYIKGTREEMQQQHTLPQVEEDKRLWTDERKFEYCMDVPKAENTNHPEAHACIRALAVSLRAEECWEEGPLRDEALEILRKAL